MEAVRTLRILGLLGRRALVECVIYVTGWLMIRLQMLYVAEFLCFERLGLLVLGFQVQIALGGRHDSSHEYKLEKGRQL